MLKSTWNTELLCSPARWTRMSQILICETPPWLDLNPYVIRSLDQEDVFRIICVSIIWTKGMIGKQTNLQGNHCIASDTAEVIWSNFLSKFTPRILPLPLLYWLKAPNIDICFDLLSYHNWIHLDTSQLLPINVALQGSWPVNTPCEQELPSFCACSIVQQYCTRCFS